MAKVSSGLFSEESGSAGANGTGTEVQTLDYKNLKEDSSNSSGVESATLESSSQSSDLSALESTTSSQLPDITALENIQFELEKLQDVGQEAEVETVVVATSTNQGRLQQFSLSPGASLLPGSTAGHTVQISPAKSLLNTPAVAKGSVAEAATTTVLPGQTLLKRPGAPGQVVTKVIITKNPNSGKTQAMPSGSTVGAAAVSGASEIVFSAPVTPQILAAVNNSNASGVVVTQASLLSPTKLATSTTPTKLIFSGKTFTAGKSPTKIAIPINQQSPQKLLQSGQFKIVSAQSIGGVTSTVTSGGIQPKKLTFSPQKVIIRPQQPGASGVRALFLFRGLIWGGGGVKKMASAETCTNTE